MKYFKVQWHITDNCNLRCKHCYQDHTNVKESKLEDTELLLEQLDELISALSKERKQGIKGHISITGGEPMLHSEFYNIIDLILKNGKYDYSILTNGSFIDENALEFFKKNPPLFIQLSMEGIQHTHDKIRGEGDFEKTSSVAKELVDAGQRAMISFTAHKENYLEFEQVANIARQLKVYKVWTDRIIPYGNGTQLEEMSAEDTYEYIQLIKKVREDKKYHRSRTIVSADRALQFFAGGSYYSCSAGKNLLTIMPDGTVYPCRRMPMDIGNFKVDSLKQIFYNNNFMQELRSNKPIKGCENCQFLDKCKGGLKCLGYAKNNDAFVKDCGCGSGY